MEEKHPYLRLGTLPRCARSIRRAAVRRRWLAAGILLAAIALSHPSGDLPLTGTAAETGTPVEEGAARRSAEAEQPLGELTAVSPGEKPQTDSNITASYEVPAEETGVKTYMDYRSITSRTSAQWHLQQYAWTDDTGFRRYGELYMVAMGTYYADSCGAVFRITLETGESFSVLISDVKADADTDGKHQHSAGNVVEFIVDADRIPRLCRLTGDMSYAGQAFRGRIAEIEKLGDNVREAADAG